MSQHNNGVCGRVVRESRCQPKPRTQEWSLRCGLSDACRTRNQPHKPTSLWVFLLLWICSCVSQVDVEVNVSSDRDTDTGVSSLSSPPTPTAMHRDPQAKRPPYPGHCQKTSPHLMKRPPCPGFYQSPASLSDAAIPSRRRHHDRAPGSSVSETVCAVAHHPSRCCFFGGPCRSTVTPQRSSAVSAFTNTQGLYHLLGWTSSRRTN